MSWRTRLALGVGIVVALTVALASSVAYALASASIDRSTERALQSRADQVVGELARFAGPGPGLPRRRTFPDRRTALAERADVAIQVLATNGSILSGPSAGDLEVTDLDRAVAAGDLTEATHDVDIGGEPHRVRAVALPRVTVGAGRTGAESIGAVQVAVSRAAAVDALGEFRARLLLLVIGGAAVAAAVGWLVAGRAVRPVQQLTEAAERIARTEDLGDRIVVEGDDELARLGQSFNAMLGALAGSRAQQRRLIEDASHELRTPLTSLRTNAELLDRFHELAPKDRTALVADLTDEIGQLQTLVDELVQLATDTTTAEPVTPVALVALAADCAARAARRSGRTITVSHRDPAVVTGRASQLERALTNLLTNAVVHTPTGTPVEVVVTGGTVAVVDHGPGIPEQDRERVLERFWRAPEARTRPGSGLGLSIVDHLVRAHHGTTFVTETPGGGATVGFSLPVVDTPG